MDDAAARANLEFAIAYALGRSLPKVPRRGPWGGLEQVQIDIAAKAVLAHLRLCGYRIDKQPRQEGTGPIAHLLAR